MQSQAIGVVRAARRSSDCLAVCRCLGGRGVWLLDYKFSTAGKNRFKHDQKHCGDGEQEAEADDVIRYFHGVGVLGEGWLNRTNQKVLGG